jgi:hypothetical protein
MSVGKEISVGKDNVGRERPLPTGLTVTDEVGRYYSFPTDFLSMKAVFPTNLSVGNVMLWCSAGPIQSAFGRRAGNRRSERPSRAPITGLPFNFVTTKEKNNMGHGGRRPKPKFLPLEKNTEVTKNGIREKCWLTT